MITFPDVLLTTYLPGGTPAIKGVDLNALQKESVRSNRMLRGPNILFSDDFTGDSLNRGLWFNGASLAIMDDSANGAFGICQITNNGATGGSLNTNASLPLIGTSDFRFRARLRIPNYSSLNNVYDAYMSMGGTFMGFHFKRGVGVTYNVQCMVAGVDVADSGVAVPVTSYADFEVRREGGLLSFLINDVVVYSTANTTSASMAPKIYTVYENANSFTVDVDYFKFYFERQGVTAALAAQALGVHCEAQTVQFAGVDQMTVTWNVPFNDTSYRMPEPGVLVTAGGGVVAVSIQSKTTTGVVLKASTVFTGEVYVEAHE